MLIGVPPTRVACWGGCGTPLAPVLLPDDDGAATLVLEDLDADSRLQMYNDGFAVTVDGQGSLMDFEPADGAAAGVCTPPQFRA